jgi:hypothetical protein
MAAREMFNKTTGRGGDGEVLRGAGMAPFPYLVSLNGNACSDGCW